MLVYGQPTNMPVYDPMLQVTSEVSYDYFKDQYSVTSSQSYAQGEQVGVKHAQGPGL